MDEKEVGFEEKLELLLLEAKKKKNVLENQEILDFFKGEILSPEKLDAIDDFLEANKVDILRIGQDDEIDPDLFIEEELEEEEEIDLEHLDLSIPEGCLLYTSRCV